MSTPKFPLYGKLAIVGVLALGLTAPGLAAAQDAKPAGTAAKTEKSDGAKKRTSRHAYRFIRLYDLNNDGKVTPDEIAKDQALVFGAMDVDGDKTLSVDEMRRRGRTLQVFRAATIFDMLDVNGDGKLSLSEVQGPSKRWFKRYDENGDGAMDATEVPNRGYRGRRGGHRRGR